MPYCSRCGVEVQASAEHCPLCGTPIQRLDGVEAEAPRYPEVPALPGRQARRLVWMVATVGLLSATLACIAIDLLQDRAVSWSLYPLTGAGVLWLLIALVVNFARRPIFVVVGQAIATAGFLVVIDLFDGRLDWFVRLALPIVAIITGATALTWLVARLCRAPTLTAASVLVGGAAASVGLDLLISAQLGPARLGWSYIVLGAAAPPVLFLLYVHFRLGRRIDLSRLLHS